MVKAFGPITAFAINTHPGLVRTYNEDKVTIQINAYKKFKRRTRTDQTADQISCSLFSLFDGHGGPHCCNYLKNSFHDTLFDELDIDGLLPSSLLSIFSKLDRNYLQEALRTNNNCSGSCVSSLIVLTGSLVAVNVGDSRAILSSGHGRLVRDITSDHKPSKIMEASRILEHGGFLYKIQSDLVT